MTPNLAYPSPTRRGAIVALAACSLSVVVMTVAMSLIAAVPAERLPSGWTLTAMAFFIPLGLSFTAVGALIEWRRPGHLIGRLMIYGGLNNSAQMAFAAYAVRALFGTPPLPGGQVSAWLFSVIATGLGLAMALIVFLFPDGRASLRRARIGVILTFVAVIPGVLIAFRPGPLMLIPVIANPVSLSIVGDHEVEVEAIYILLAASVTALGISTLWERARRAHGPEKQQIKWVFAGTAISGAGLIVAAPQLFGTETVDLARFTVAVALISIPATIGIAILRHHLYDIDALIHRTLVYGVASAVLASTYAAGVVLFQALLRPVTGGSEIAVAASTLLVVALFQPLRSRVQQLVDRRFYRSRYDAARTLDAFTTRMRDQVDIDAVRDDVLEVVETTLTPAHAGFWLRGAKG
jgi:hypothetical protein